MSDDTAGKRADELRNVAVASILDVTSQLMYVESLDAVLNKIAKTVAETFGMAKVSIGIRERDTGLFGVRACYGFDPVMAESIKKVKYTMERMERDLKPELKIGRSAYYVPAEYWELDDEDLLFVARPERIDRVRKLPDDWHECDYIDFLMYQKDESLLGYLEIDEPMNGKVPTEETLRAIEVFSDIAAIAIQNSELYDKIDSERKKIELLLDLIGHDVNNYAQGVSGFIELAMSRSDVPIPARKSLAKAHDQVLNLNKLVRNVKLYGKVESAGAKEIRATDLAPVVKEAFRAVKESLQNKSIEMVFNDDGAKRLADVNELSKDVFLNIFSNAAKFDDHEHVVVEVDIAPLTEGPREFWLVSVSDHGPGIDDSIKNLVFDRFTQGPTTSIGTGLGLYIAKALVEGYKGRIWVQDRAEGDRSKGSVFKVLLPKSATIA